MKDMDRFFTRHPISLRVWNPGVTAFGRLAANRATSSWVRSLPHFSHPAAVIGLVFLGGFCSLAGAGGSAPSLVSASLEVNSVLLLDELEGVSLPLARETGSLPSGSVLF